MKTTRIEIESELGQATIETKGRMIIIKGRTMGGEFKMVGHTGHHDENVDVACILQRTLDGYAGTNGDIAPYIQAIAAFE